MINRLDQTKKSLKKVTVIVVENRVGGKLLCEKSLLPPAPMSSFEVIY